MSDSPSAEHRLLTKGLEEEVYTGTLDADPVPLSHRIAADMSGFVTEPDARNVEYTTDPYRSYQVLLDRLMAKRCQLRRYLVQVGDYTLIPGSTLSLEESDEFVISNPNNPYYRFIRDTYGTKVVTASTHINVGIPEPDALIAAYRLLRAEASMYLALTANSPFLRGKPTGAHSNRWLVFPQTPPNVPFFTSHDHFRKWVAAQIESGAMFNPRHLWLSIRPNGDATPTEIERLELRICDRISQPRILGAVIALFEARIWQVLEGLERGDRDLDPLAFRDDRELQEISLRNEHRAAESSLDATITDWRTGKDLPMREWVEACWRSCLPTARAHGFEDRLEPIGEILADGNLAQQWLAQVATGLSPREVLRRSIVELTEIDRQYDPECPSPVAPDTTEPPKI
ncbi:MAG: putative glutamate--cysteine ligase [Planctomycetota bacterium]|jgi:predicted glutamate--cysteine ligase